jgi:hypothetical protein
MKPCIPCIDSEVLQAWLTVMALAIASLTIAQIAHPFEQMSKAGTGCTECTAQEDLCPELRVPQLLANLVLAIVLAGAACLNTPIDQMTSYSFKRASWYLLRAKPRDAILVKHIQQSVGDDHDLLTASAQLSPE